MFVTIAAPTPRIGSGTTPPTDPAGVAPRAVSKTSASLDVLSTAPAATVDATGADWGDTAEPLELATGDACVAPVEAPGAAL